MHIFIDSWLIVYLSSEQYRVDAVSRRIKSIILKVLAYIYKVGGAELGESLPGWYILKRTLSKLGKWKTSVIEKVTSVCFSVAKC